MPVGLLAGLNETVDTARSITDMGGDSRGSRAFVPWVAALPHLERQETGPDLIPSSERFPPPIRAIPFPLLPRTALPHVKPLGICRLVTCGALTASSPSSFQPHLLSVLLTPGLLQAPEHRPGGKCHADLTAHPQTQGRREQPPWVSTC